MAYHVMLKQETAAREMGSILHDGDTKGHAFELERLRMESERMSMNLGNMSRKKN